MDVYVFGKVVPLVLFCALFVGISVWAQVRLKPEHVAHMARIPLREDDDVEA